MVTENDQGEYEIDLKIIEKYKTQIIERHVREQETHDLKLVLTFNDIAIGIVCKVCRMHEWDLLENIEECN